MCRENILFRNDCISREGNAGGGDLEGLPRLCDWKMYILLPSLTASPGDGDGDDYDETHKTRWGEMLHMS